MADNRHVGKYWKYHNSLTVNQFGRDLGGRIPSHSRYVRHDAVAMATAWQRSLPSNGALDIQQFWAFGGRTREPILMTFSTQQQLKTAMTVT